MKWSAKAYSFTVVRPEYYGVTPPISRDAPSAQEVTQTADLMKELRAQGTFEPEEDSRKRYVLT
jgi:poly(A) polymerase